MRQRPMKCCGRFSRGELSAIEMGQMSESTLRDRLPEETLLENGEASGLTIRIHGLASFEIAMVGVIRRAESVTVVRRVIDVGPRGVLSSASHEQFPSRPCFVAKLDRQLSRLGVAEDKVFVVENVLDGVSLTSRYRTSSGMYCTIHLFCWEESPDHDVCKLGNWLKKLACSPVRRLRRQAALSRFW